MMDKVEFRSGPLAGFTMQGNFSRKAVDVERSPRRYPARIIVEYDTLPTEEVRGNDPDAAYTEGRDTGVATYEFDEGLGIFEIVGQSFKRLGQAKFDPMR